MAQGAARAKARWKQVWARPWARRSIKGCLAVGLIGVGALAALVVVNLVVVGSASDRRYTEVAAVPQRPVAIVFGAGLFGSDPSPALASRLDGAIELYQQGNVDHLLMSGDNRRADYDEVTVMRDYAIERGVPGAAITRDYAGFDTYDTCIRARDVFGVRAAVLVTQDYHLSRAIYTCDQLGIDVVGLAIPDWRFRPGDLDYRYSTDDQISYRVREWFARGKAFFDVNIGHRPPALGGPYEGLTET